jgi:hypothetical protein
MLSFCGTDDHVYSRKRHDCIIAMASPSDHGIVMPLLRTLYELQGIGAKAQQATNAVGRLLESEDLGGIWMLKDCDRAACVLRPDADFGYDVEFGVRRTPGRGIGTFCGFPSHRPAQQTLDFIKIFVFGIPSR